MKIYADGVPKGFKFPEGTHWTHEVQKIRYNQGVSWKEALAIRRELKKVAKVAKVAKKKVVAEKVVAEKVVKKKAERVLNPHEVWYEKVVKELKGYKKKKEKIFFLEWMLTNTNKDVLKEVMLEELLKKLTKK